MNKVGGKGKIERERGRLRGREENRNQEITKGTGRQEKEEKGKVWGRQGRKVDIKNDVFLFIKFGEGTQKGGGGENNKIGIVYTPVKTLINFNGFRELMCL